MSGTPAVRVLVWLVVVLAAVPARAQPKLQLPLQNFRPAPSPRDYLVTESGLTLGHLQPAAAVLTSYSHRPLERYDTEQDKRLGEVVRYRVNLDLLLALGLLDFLELGVALPATLAQEAGESAPSPYELAPLSAALGDLRIYPKARIRTKFGATFAVAVPFSVPTGSREQLLGDEWLTLSPRLIFSIEGKGVGAALNGGIRIRRNQDVALVDGQRLRVDDEAFWSVGLKLPLWTGKLELLVDGFFSLSLYEQNLQQFPVEVLGGFRAYLPFGIVANVGAGAGATRGVGAPLFRVYGGLGYEYGRGAEEAKKAKPADQSDPDGDGLVGQADACPDEAEDRDGFKDDDGCPEADNDNDGIPDPQDRCPMEAEDRDGFKDDDGCPEADNDNDGIPDGSDRCPLRAEDRDGFQDSDGCPDLDSDGDQVPDTTDRCPLRAEDRDGFQDSDGCPDQDNDNDGIHDIDDRCPLQPETVNGVDDDDGCPDRSAGPVQIERGRITIPPVYFATGRDAILPRSYPVLRQVAATLRDNPWIRRVRIEGHTDSRGDDNANRELSERRATAVRVFLVQSGVDPARLESRGYGESQPIASNATRRGRELNRRVELVIVDPPEKAAP